MKIELSNNKVFFDNEGVKKEIHPFWLRERVNGDKFVDTKTQQRLFDPTQIKILRLIILIYLIISLKLLLVMVRSLNYQ